MPVTRSQPSSNFTPLSGLRRSAGKSSNLVNSLTHWPGGKAGAEDLGIGRLGDGETDGAGAVAAGMAALGSAGLGGADFGGVMAATGVAGFVGAACGDGLELAVAWRSRAEGLGAGGDADSTLESRASVLGMNMN